ncbi:transcription-repair-coupling factor [Anaeromicropila herbilytica]|uniref:Transcription-repair-coupling factor n=1 Tax=Anaeromicropila herbilytica TaxID=2785025 RepID=A0A7R7EHT6_9FIRM|nr:transcription-repair coupling factor [Anaeromicropila herbilytica]BCN28970.1 transcription-repair-coupling factor [Anaeromicropila herbilytica]
MKTFYEPLNELKEYHDIKQSLLLRSVPIQITGCIDSQKCHLMSALSSDYKNTLIITYNEMKAKEIYDDYRLYNKDVLLYPAKDIMFYSADIHGNAIVKERLNVLKSLIEGKGTTVVMTIDGGMDHILPLEMIEKRVLLIEEGTTLDLEKLKEKLVFLGYERTGQVEGQGQFAIRGGIIDIFTLTEEVPYRIELWDDEIDSIRTFDINSQRSIERVQNVKVYPAAELILDETTLLTGIQKIEKEKEAYQKALRDQLKTEEAHRIDTIIEEFIENMKAFQGSLGIDSYIKYFYEDTISFFDYFNNIDSVIFLDEPSRIGEKGEAVELEFREGMIGRIEKGYILPGQVDVIYGVKELLAKLSHANLVNLSTMDYKVTQFNIRNKYDIAAKSVNSYNNNFEVLVKDLEKWKKSGYRVVLLSSSRTRAKRLSDDLREYDLNAFYSEDLERGIQSSEIMVAAGNVHRGFEYPMIQFVVISESDIFGAEKKKARKKSSYEGKKIQSFTDLNIGDYVVHENHGLGIYKGIEKIEVDHVTKDYIKLEYGNGGVLYILATGLDVIQKYASSEAKRPKLNSLGSQEWKNTKTKVRKAVKEIAKELVELYAIRQSKKGYQFGEDTVWQNEFEEMFPYDETRDQLKAIEETKMDMESTKIMDRLICGDVGYGKTEIAIRAAFKAVADGKQVVYLVPTTILAQQHYNTFVQRMKDFPISIDMLSRFRTPAQQKKALERLKKGSLDIIIGTHRVLSKDVEFKDLGLLIVDEEQRFGVTHKEKIKQLKGDVDVLTLSATPIPRTLHMSLIGIRDMSVLEEPPVDRMPIQTYVLEQNDEIVREAINRELARGGQVYYVYNRVTNIDEVALTIQKLVPEANVAFAHGQMSERELEKIMFGFINGEIDVLVSTTIIETGLDIANVNTMIIHDADKLGLSQLYQLRGRVGRSNRSSYAFLMYRRDKMLKEIAEKRLQAIKEFTELGSGFKIAMRDLEIRGAGNLLGAQQHGHMESVGYDLYCKMLNEAVVALKGGIEEEDIFDTTVDIGVDAFIPATYIKSEFQKLDMYKRIAGIENEEEFLDMQEEMLDRFGDLPQSVNNLLNIALLKGIAHNAYVSQIIHKVESIKFAMYPKAKVDLNKIPLLLDKYKNVMKFSPEATPYFLYELKQGKKVIKLDNYTLFETIKSILNDIDELIQR